MTFPRSLSPFHFSSGQSRYTHTRHTMGFLEDPQQSSVCLPHCCCEFTQGNVAIAASVVNFEKIFPCLGDETNYSEL